MITIYFNSKIFKIANNLIDLAKDNLIDSNNYPKSYYYICNLGTITLLKSNEQYPMHDDSYGNINIVTFLNNNGGMRFGDTDKNIILDVKAIKGLSMKFETPINHEPYTTNGNRWVLLQREII